jgi:hypothetical protein
LELISARRSSAVSSTPMVTTRFHGTIASDASSSLKLIARSRSAACWTVRCPLSADESTMRSSSRGRHGQVQFLDGFHADARRRRFAEPSNSLIRGTATADTAERRRQGSGDRSRRWRWPGSSGEFSPNTIWADGGQDEGRGRTPPRTQPSRKARGLGGPVRSTGDRRLGDEAQNKGGDRDSELRRPTA